MAPRLVVCRCDPAWLALAVCDVCEHRDLERLLERRGLVAREHPVRDAFDALVEAYRRDADDRARDAADDYRMGASA